MDHNAVGLFALSSAISCHHISKIHYGIQEEWYQNKWFWLGLLGNLPALVAFLGHILLTRTSSDETPGDETDTQ